MAGSLTDIIVLLTNLILMTVPILVALALLFFFWGLANFVFAVSGDKEAVKKGKDRMIWGLVALFFILSIGGLVAILQTTFFGGRLNTGSGGSLHSAPTSNPPIVTEDRSEPFQFRTTRFCVFGRGINCDTRR